MVNTDADDKLPSHVALILDGNRRWAKKRGLPAIEGHRKGALQVRKLLRHLFKKGIHTVTLWVFSTENWNREEKQVRGLLSLFQEFASVYFNDALDDKVQVVHIGRKDRLPEKLKTSIEKYENATKDFETNTLNIALDYGGRDEIVRAVNAWKAQNSEPLTEENLNNFLDTKNQKYPNPDMVIRTGGEMRSSGFMIWQAAYAEYFFIPTYLPDVSENDLDELIEEYQARQRRFGS